MSNQQPKWPPDWRDNTQYAAQRTMLEWRWEFLRRRQDYQRAFHECDRRFAQAMSENPDLVLKWERGSPKESWDASEELSKQAGTYDVLQHFGLSGPLNPEKSYDDATLSTRFERPDWGQLTELHEGDVAKHYARGVIIVAFDLKYDLDEQLDETRQMLQDERRHLDIEPGVKRKHPERWAQYLQVLDARNANATFAEIGRVILRLTSASYDEQAAAGKQKHSDAVNLQDKLTS